MTPAVALSIAGTDSGGGAGLAADLRTFAAHGVFGALVVTAVTAQDTAKVHGVVTLEPGDVDAQIEAVLGDLPVAAAKTGMLASLAVVELLAGRAAAGRLPPLVVDPVMVSSSGSALLEGDAVAAYRHLLPYAVVATPNLPEAEALLARTIPNLEAMREAAKELQGLGTSLVVVKGGHLHGPLAIDVCYDGSELVELSAPMLPTRNVHGTGCTLSAAIAANLARGVVPIEAVRAAKTYVSAAIASSADWSLGVGHGPLDHFPKAWALEAPRAAD